MYKSRYAYVPGSRGMYAADPIPSGNVSRLLSAFSWYHNQPPPYPPKGFPVTCSGSMQVPGAAAKVPLSN
ncbi:hypothetical protein P167DRAFT_536671 [Morchella conica CCBAS932]|uniref:Uncharacterized protein n=1 Tax=Morchella conica CCBAS932 TaxID=1392247 RepID=A0A3N4KQB1_9PEZI|nr:hypothetical protein P167DRAFT_536671 [Morchella conica CCBAS932]